MRLTSVVLAGVLKPLLQTVNMVSAPAVAKERGVTIEETRREQQGNYENYIRLTLVTERQERSVAGTVFGDAKPRIIQIKGINMESRAGRKHALYHQQGQTRLHWSSGHPVGHFRAEHRDLQSRP